MSEPRNDSRRIPSLACGPSSVSSVEFADPDPARLVEAAQGLISGMAAQLESAERLSLYCSFGVPSQQTGPQLSLMSRTRQRPDPKRVRAWARAAARRAGLRLNGVDISTRGATNPDYWSAVHVPRERLMELLSAYQLAGAQKRLRAGGPSTAAFGCSPTSEALFVAWLRSLSRTSLGQRLPCWLEIGARTLEVPLEELLAHELAAAWPARVEALGAVPLAACAAMRHGLDATALHFAHSVALAGEPPDRVIWGMAVHHVAIAAGVAPAQELLYLAHFAKHAQKRHHA